jgi:DNA polymerase-3 subunit alpha
MESFVHLHVHTEYSLLDGANPVDRLVQAAVEDGHEALAITDHGNLFGAIEFYQAARKAGVKPILGCEVYVAERSMREPHDKRTNPYTHLTLLARNAEGWGNLMSLTTDAHLEGHHFRPRIDLELLAQRSKGLICLSGCMSGPVNRLLRRGDEPGARAMAGRLKDLFGAEHFFLEVMRNGIEEQNRLTEGMARMRAQVDVPLVATNDIHYLRHEDCKAQDALICLNTGARLSDPGRWKMDTDTLYFRSAAEMNRIFGDLPEALATTNRVAEMVNVEIELGTPRLPVFNGPDGRPPEALFREQCEIGFARCYPGNPAEARERLEFEMRTIQEMGFISYFLIVWDLVRYAREKGIPVGPGRGSAAGSLVAFALGITRIDPLKYDLLFERFLNPSRISMPDIDIDFCKDRREEMIAYARQRYGSDRVCQIITFGKLKAKNALRDMGRVLEVPLPEVDRIAKKIPDGPGVTLAASLEGDPELQALRQASAESERWFDLALRVEGLSRNAGVHAAGVIIADRPLREIVPLARLGEAVTTQWDMKACEEIGLLKMDFLGLRTLTILEEGLRLIAARTGARPDLDALPLDDAATYALLQRADTEGVFQLESSGMRRLLADIQPSRYEDLVAVLALFRPGPLGSGLHEIYARRKHGKEPVQHLHPLLEPVLSETYGVLIYQEQIMRVAQRMGGFSLADADSLRKAMGKKKPEMMAKFEDRFVAGAVAQKVEKALAKQIWDMMVKFAEYGFNKSHSTGYAMVTFQAAWMKAHHPAEFYAASFTFEAADTDKLRALIEDARRHEIRVLPPCVNASSATFSVMEGRAVRFGLEAVKGMGRGAAEALVKARSMQAGGRFADLEGFLTEAVARNLTKTGLEALAKAGACDSFELGRLELVSQLEERMRRASYLAKDRERGQGFLFGGAAAAAPAPVAITGSASEVPTGSLPSPAAAVTDWKAVLAAEKQALGLYLTRHPLDDYRDLLGGVSPWNTRTVIEAGQDAIVALAGVASQVTIKPTRKDPSRKMGRLRIEDLYGSIPALVFSRVLEQHAEQMVEDYVGLFEGRLQVNNDEVEMLIEKIRPLGARENLSLRGMLEVQVGRTEPPVARIQDILRRHPGAARVRIQWQDAGGRNRVLRADTSWNVQLGPALLDELNALLGAGAARASMDRPVTQRRERPVWAARSESAS